MTDRKHFEAMLEALINDDQETAKEIFHNIVVAKSRDIYEELLAEDFDLSEKAEEEEEEESVEEDAEEEGAVEEASDEEEEEGSDDDVGGDATDDFIDDVEDSDGEEGEEGDEEIEDRVMDLEDALEELKAEFEQLMAGEEEEGHHDDMGDMGGDEFGGADLEVDEEDFGAPVMEYTNKVTPPKHGDNGANTKSVVAGKNDMGGTTANIAKGGVAKGEGTQGGLLKPTTSLQDAGNVNVPGGKGATKLKSVSKGHGAEKSGAGEQADNKKSTIGSR